MDQDLSFDWDDANTAHIARHQIAPTDVEQALANQAMDVGYEMVDGEDRWTSVGHTNELRILIVVWTMRGESIRVVTAFDAGKNIKAEYWREKGW